MGKEQEFLLELVKNSKGLSTSAQDLLVLISLTGTRGINYIVDQQKVMELYEYLKDKENKENE